MSTRTASLFLACLASAALILAGNSTARAQSKDADPIELVKGRQQALVQKYEKDIQAAKKEAREVAKTDKKQAILKLAALRDQIGTDSDLPEDARITMVERLNISINEYNRLLTQAPPPEVSIPPLRRDDSKKDPGDGRKSNDTANNEIKRVQQAKAQDDYIKKTREENLLALELSNDKAHMPQANDISFPNDWQAITAKRSQINMTPEEKKIIKALSTPLNIQLEDSTLKDVVEYLQDKTGVVINVPNSVLEDKGITYKTPVSVNLKNVTMRTILKKVLADVGLTYVVDKGTILVTTEERAKEMLTVRTYYVGDLIAFTGGRLGFGNKAAAITAMNDIIGVIIGTVEPNSWWVNGGNGTIAYDPVRMTLVVKQTAEIHFMLGLNIGSR
jgi:hypothetical protein